MKTIWKFPLDLTDKQTIRMPREAQPLAVQVQFDTICLWAKVDTEKPMEDREIRIEGTGHELDDMGDFAEREYIGTVQTSQGAFVWHVFRLLTYEQVMRTRG